MSRIWGFTCGYLYKWFSFISSSMAPVTNGSLAGGVSSPEPYQSIGGGSHPNLPQLPSQIPVPSGYSILPLTNHYEQSRSVAPFPQSYTSRASVLLPPHAHTISPSHLNLSYEQPFSCHMKPSYESHNRYQSPYQSRTPLAIPSDLERRTDTTLISGEPNT